jgi:hypothetical protein
MGNTYFTGEDKLSSGATTLSEGIVNYLGNSVNYYVINSSHADTLPASLNANNTVAVAVVAELPYAEYMGDIGNPTQQDDWYQFGATYNQNDYLKLPQNQTLALLFNAKETAAIQALKAKGIKVVTVVYSGRPVILSEGGSSSPYNNSDAVIAAFLPGTLGGAALSNALFGQYIFRQANAGLSNTLTFQWPCNMQEVSSKFTTSRQFSIGYGLPDRSFDQ